jgi:hypothetical protein
MDEKDGAEKAMCDFKFTVNVPVVLDGEFIDSVLVGAFEGGSNYWIRKVKITKDIDEAKYASEVVALGGEIAIHELEPDEDNPGPHLLDRDKFIVGYTKYAEWATKNGRQWYTDAGDIDAGEADVILQFAIFGDCIYG